MGDVFQRTFWKRFFLGPVFSTGLLGIGFGLSGFLDFGLIHQILDGAKKAGLC